MHPRSGLWDRATQPGKTQVRAGAPSPHRLPPLSQRRQQPGPTGPPGARPGQGYTDSGLGVLGQKGWPPGSERDALGSSFLLPDSLPQFPHGPEEVPSGETWGGGVLGRMASMEHRRPAHPRITEPVSRLPAVRCRSVAQPVAAAESRGGGPQICAGCLPGRPPHPGPAGHTRALLGKTAVTSRGAYPPEAHLWWSQEVQPSRQRSSRRDRIALRLEAAFSRRVARDSAFLCIQCFGGWENALSWVHCLPTSPSRRGIPFPLPTRAHMHFYFK